MKRLLLIIAILAFFMTATAKPDNQQDCLALSRAYVASCIAGGTADWLCTQQANGVYCTCMHEHGEQQPQGCPDQ